MRKHESRHEKLIIGEIKMYYRDMVVRYGDDNAYCMLLLIERSARMYPSLEDVGIDDEAAREARLQKALDSLNKVNYAN